MWHPVLLRVEGLLSLRGVNHEWGFTQSMGDSAQFFEAELANNRSHGAAGNFYWNANYLLDPTTYDVGPGTPLVQAAVVANAPG